MKQGNHTSKEAAELRRRAEKELKAKTPEAGFSRTDEENRRLLHELQVHQIELEMQNAELHQARDEEEKVRERYVDLYDFAPVGYLTLDREGTIQAANLTVTGLLGTERARLIGRRFEKYVADEARSAFTAFLRKVFDSRAKDVCEVPLLKEGPHPLFVQIEAVADAAGQECRVAVIDITERRWGDDRVRRSENQLAEAQKLAHFGNWQWDAVADTITGSDEFYRIFGRHFSSYEGFIELVHPDARDRVNMAVKETLDRQSPYNIHYRIVHPGGAVRIIHAQGEAVTDGTGRVVRMVGTAQDVTVQRQLEEKLEILHTELSARAVELEAANIELEAFNYTVSHDLRRPLTAINLNCQMIQELCGNQLGDECNRYLREMYEGTLRMDRLIDSLLNFAHIARVDIHHDKVDLSGIAQEVAMGLEVSGPERRVTFSIEKGIAVDGDAELLRVVLNNLLGNAWKYTHGREETAIEFGVTEIDGKPACFVRDNGPGFDMTYADKLFKPFQRIPGSIAEGHGIGLATVQRIIHRHGGQVWAEGVPGKGATFYFTLSA
jgi:PAS domain S-box-containing protein